MKPIRSLITATSLTLLGVITLPIVASAIEIAQAPNQDTNQAPQVPVPVPGQTPARPRAIPRVERKLPKYRTIWEHGRTLRDSAGPVESTYRVNNREGTRLILDVAGSIEVQSAQVQFDDGQVQQITALNPSYTTGQTLLLDFGGRRRVQSVQIVAKTSTKKAAYSVQLID
jgi:hypothetical protein